MRNIKDLRLVTARKEKAKAFLEMSDKGTCPPAWKPYLPITQEMAEIMAELRQDAISPTFTDIEALELCATNGVLAAIIHAQIQQQTVLAMTNHEIEQIEAEKNASPPMESTGRISLSARNRSGNTRTTSPNPTGDTPANI